MNEEFKKIIIGEKKPSDLKNYITQQNNKILNENSYLKKWTQISELFLEYANKKYREGFLDNASIGGLLQAYNNFISDNQNVREYLLKPITTPPELEKMNHIIVNMVETFISQDTLKKQQKIKKLKREYGYIHPLLLGIITSGIGVIFLANIYLSI